MSALVAAVIAAGAVCTISVIAVSLLRDPDATRYWWHDVRMRVRRRGTRRW
ncbi:MAG: hypothetical protein HYX51_00135 [Chloroflexi bacterium]|nr:hypothetical protein [Chloroflexota bacterium]